MERCHKSLNSSSSRIWTGLIILGIGLVFLLQNLGVDIPHWVVSWHSLLILVGLLVGYKRRFQGFAWFILVLIGAVFTIEEVTAYDLSKYYFAAIFISLGVFLIVKPKSQHHPKWGRRWGRPGPVDEQTVQSEKGDPDVLDSVSVFGGSHQNVYSKNFKGGDVTAVFGGADVNLTQADFAGTVELDVVAIFGGMKLIVPAGWEIKSEVTTIFGGIDDKRGASVIITEPRKTLVLKGVALFGGIDIRNF
ncbi:LiaF transmembrane domain-containing protein [Pedobacter deserti]|uniref:LiaF transmembrane domain-containing protein n=1 Tax=Pedobacter deserti TaxID=2817382 RepID=UPI00210ED2EB|nr:LiaF domain-containing protein [Pedobacter sp. SYSU D00382]